MANDLTCEICDKEGLNLSTIKVHEKSQSHIDLVADAVILPPDPWGETTVIKGKMVTVRQLWHEGVEDPIQCAKDLRKLFAINRWPNRKQPKSVRTVLEEGGVPIFDAGSRFMTDGEVRKQRYDQLAIYKGQL